MLRTGTHEELLVDLGRGSLQARGADPITQNPLNFVVQNPPRLADRTPNPLTM